MRSRRNPRHIPKGRSPAPCALAPHPALRRVLREALRGHRHLANDLVHDREWISERRHAASGSASGGSLKERRRSEAEPKAEEAVLHQPTPPAGDAEHRRPTTTQEAESQGVESPLPIVHQVVRPALSARWSRPVARGGIARSACYGSRVSSGPGPGIGGGMGSGRGPGAGTGAGSGGDGSSGPGPGRGPGSGPGRVGSGGGFGTGSGHGPRCDIGIACVTCMACIAHLRAARLTRTR
jgi:hypothetical protein